MCLKLRNNCIDGRRVTSELFSLLHENHTLTALDLGNSDSIKNRNRIYNEGLKSLLEGAASNELSVLSELHLQSTCITGKGLSAFLSLTPSIVDLQILDLSSNELGNHSVHYLQHLIPSLVSLNLSNTKLTSDGCQQLAKIFSERSCVIKYLDLSSNRIDIQGFCYLCSGFKQQPTLMALNVA
jgi:Ran GTPase-activating protein (RanGAP) involved in mRNA processing and transport